mmetsp:Transcript_23344/g.48605  ORF Transcript_23344/g.48605 Transcript_23344/m.48605 type:complete len:141 (-) Transcript_23344:116-538(-)
MLRAAFHSALRAPRRAPAAAPRPLRWGAPGVASARGAGAAATATAKQDPDATFRHSAAAEECSRESVVATTPLMQADARVVLVCDALLCFGGSLAAAYVAVTHDPNRKEDRPALRRGEYIAGASVVGAVALVILTLRGGK